MKLHLLTCVILFFVLELPAQELYRNDFSDPLAYTCLRQLSGRQESNGLQLPDWGGNLFQNLDPAELDGRIVYPLFLYSVAGNPNYALVDIPAEAFPETGKVRITAAIKTNRPDYINFVFAENAPFNRVPEQFAPVDAGTERVYVSAEFDRKHPDKPFFAGIGITMGGGNVWLQIDSITVEVGDLPNSEPPYAEDCPAPIIGMDWQYLRSNFDISVIDAWQKEKERLIKNGLETAPEATARFQLMEQLEEIAANGMDLSRNDITLANIGNLCAQARFGQLNIKVKDLAYPYGMSSAMIPGNDETLEVHVLKDGIAHQVVILDNNSDAQMNFTVRCEGDILPFTSLSILNWIAGAPDFPQPLNSWDIFPVPAFALNSFKVTFDTAGLAPGTYTGTIVVSPLDANLPERNIHCSVLIMDCELREEDYPHVFTYEYNMNQRPEQVKFMTDMKVDTFMVDFTESNGSFEPLDKLMAAAEKAGVRDKVKYIWCEDRNIAAYNGFGPTGNSGWTSDRNEWVDRLSAKLAEYGIDHDHWTLLTYDECAPAEFLRDLKLIKDHNPAIRTHCTISFYDIEQYNLYDPYMNDWTPTTDSLLDRNALPYQWFSANAGLNDNRIWTYYCDATPQQEIAKYAIQGWIAWRANCVGICYYRGTINFPRPQDPYNFGMVYCNGPVGTNYVASRRWDVWRQSIEDYRLLTAAARIDRQATEEIADWILDEYDPGKLNNPMLSEKLPEARKLLIDIITKGRKVI